MPPVDSPGALKSGLPQQLRLISAIGYFGVLLLLARYLNGQFWPPYGLEGLWFYSAAAALLVGEFVLEPFFTRPADAIASGVTILVAASTASLADAEVSNHEARLGRVIVIVLAASVVGVAVIAIAFKDTAGLRGRFAGLAAGVISRVGRARWLFSALLLAAGYAAFAHSSGRVAALYLTWFAIVGLAPIEAALQLARRGLQTRPMQRGVVEALDDPSTITVKLPKGTTAELGDEVNIEGGAARGTVVEVTRLTEEPHARISLAESAPVRIGSHVTVRERREDDPVAGHVVEGTSIEEVVFASVPHASELGLEEGRLVQAEIGGAETLFQIVGAEIVPRSEGDLRRHLVRVRGRKLGRWNPDRTVFDPVAWVPSPGTPVRLLAAVPPGYFNEQYVGHVPGTTYGVQIDPHLAVTHNTAILGILGIGKTHLAWELMQRMLVADIKVVALDITGRYSAHFADLCPPETEEAIANSISARIAANVANRRVRDDQAGNLHDFQDAVDDVLQQFVEGDDRLLILNPNRFEVTRMEGRPYQGEANMMAAVTMVEVTRMVAERLLNLLQARPREPEDESANLCLVLEEAHSLVPEWSSATNDAERQAVNGTARAVLQGRKYGYGSLVVTQRTANVTKSILNQCNTIFGMRVFDATGMGFLENYIGATYSQLLASLRDRQAVVFGRASSCNSPLIVELNDTTAFLEGFWEQRVPNLPATDRPVEEPEPPTPGADDEIPF